MATGPIVKWDAPARVPIGEVSPGCVVFVRVAPQAGANPLTPAANGTLPHVVYAPTLEPLGSTGFQIVDMGTGQLGPHVGESVRSFSKSSFPSKSPEYWVDIGVPFVAPWLGQLFIEGGLAAAGPAPQDIEVTISRPELMGELLNGVNSLMIEMTRHRLEMIGSRPIDPPTITYANVGATPVAIPRGASKIIAPGVINVNFVVGGGAAIPIRIAPGAAVPIGWLAGGGGTFASAGGNIPLVSFVVSIA